MSTVQNSPWIPYILIAVAVATVLGIGLYYLIRFLRGGIKLYLPGTAFVPGDAIAGTLELTTKRPINGHRLIVTLIGKKVIRERHDNKVRTRTIEFFRNEVELEHARSYPAGYKQKYNFIMQTPEDKPSELENSGIGQAIKMVAKMVSPREAQYKWYLEGRLDAVGVDLAKSKKIFFDN